MIVKLLIVLLYLVSQISANPEDALNSNDTLILDNIDHDSNITDISQPDFPLDSSPDENNTSILVDPEEVFASSIDTLIKQRVQLMTSQALIGETACVTQEICQSINASQCKEGVCECLETHVPNLNDTDCLKIASETENQCEIDKQCKKFSSKCVKNQCLIDEKIEKTPTSGVLSQSSPDNGSTSGTPIYLSLLVLNFVFLLFN